jgi:GH25 family lysozyme M1 (1,4-beta-N-acetylmuramidase)
MKRSALIVLLSLCTAVSCGKVADNSTSDTPAPSAVTAKSSTETSTVATSGTTTQTTFSTSTTTATGTTTVTSTVTTSNTKIATTVAPVKAVTTTKKNVQITPDPDGLVLAWRDTVDVYEELTVGELITQKNVELVSPNEVVDTSRIGSNDVIVEYIHDGKHKNKLLTYNVVDTVPPVLLNAGWSPSHQQYTTFDLNDYIGFADNYDSHPTLTVSGSVNPNVIGDYPLSYTITDCSGNSISNNITISVTDYIPPAVDNNPRVSFETFASVHGKNGNRIGIDVSTWQGDIDFNAVRDAGCSFVIIRIGYYYSHVVMDDWFRSNIEKAKAAGLDIGVYFYTTDNTEQGVREHARWIAEELGGQKLDFPVAFDWEEFSNFQQYGMSIHDLNDIYLAFDDEMKKYGYSTMLYSSKNFLCNFWSQQIQRDYPIWLAHFVTQTDHTGPYDIWQGSCYGHIPGINGDVDMNVLYKPLPLK